MTFDLLALALALTGSTVTIGATASGRDRTVDTYAPRAHYTVDCRIDPAADLLEGMAVIQLKNDRPWPISRLTFDWPLDPGQRAEIVVAGKTVAPLGTGQPEGRLSVLPSPDVQPVVFDLPKLVKPGGRVEIRLRFSRKLLNWGTVGGYFLTHWHPRLWWGFFTHDDFDVKLDAPCEYTVGASGPLDPKTGRYRVDGAKSFGVLLVKDCHVTEATAGDVQIRCIHAAKGAECAKLLVKTAVDVIGFYRQTFGFYPHRSLTIVPGGDSPYGGWWVATAISGIHGMEQMDKATELHWKWITAHEIGHMYWGDYVLEKDSPDWLWIGLGIYADREYVRSRGLGESQHRRLIDRYIEGVRKGIDTTVERPAEQLEDIDFDHNNIVVHGKGFSIISALCCVLGKETFERAYVRCLREYAGRRLGSAEFQRVCEEESGQDLGWFFDQWVRSNRYLSYDIASQECKSEGTGYRSTVTVRCGGTLKMPVPVETTSEDGSRQIKLTERLLSENVLVFESASPLKQVRIDPKGELAIVVPPPTTEGQVRK